MAREGRPGSGVDEDGIAAVPDPSENSGTEASDAAGGGVVRPTTGNGVVVPIGESEKERERKRNKERAVSCDPLQLYVKMAAHPRYHG